MANISNVLGASTDYLLGINNEPTKDLSVLSAAATTGLNSETIESIRNHTSKEDDSELLNDCAVSDVLVASDKNIYRGIVKTNAEMINALLSCDVFERFISCLRDAIIMGIVVDVINVDGAIEREPQSHFLLRRLDSVSKYELSIQLNKLMEAIKCDTMLNLGLVDTKSIKSAFPNVFK